MSAAGVAQAIMSLVAEDDGVGIPRVLVSRRSLQAADLADGARRASVPGRAGGYAHLFAGRGGRAATVETSATRFVVLDDVRSHTNHYLDSRLAALAPSPSPGSVARLDRLRALLEERSPTTPEDAMGILADHGGRPESICLHPDEADGDEASATVFAMVCHLEERRMWVSPGNPCRVPFEEVDLGEAA